MLREREEDQASAFWSGYIYNSSSNSLDMFSLLAKLLQWLEKPFGYDL